MNWNKLRNFVEAGLMCLVVLTGCDREPPQVQEKPAVALWIDGEPVMLDSFMRLVAIKVKTWVLEEGLTDEEFARLVDLTVKELVESRVLTSEAERLNWDLPEPISAGSSGGGQEYPEGFESLGREDIEWETRVASQLKLMELSRMIASRLYGERVIDEAATRSFYDENISRFTEPESLEIQVIRVNDPDLADDIHKKLKRGWAFTKLAENYSNYRGEGAKGQTFRKHIGEFPEEFELELFKLKPGRISEVLPSPEGYFVYKLIKRYPEVILPFEDVKDRLQDELRSREESRIYQQWLKAEVEKITVKMGTPLPFPGGSR